MESPKSDEAVAALKQQWRERLKIIRQEIGSERRKAASKNACQQLFDLTKDAQLVLSFASFGTEIDLWPFNQKLIAEGRLVLPRMANQQLQLYRINSLEHLQKHAWGMQEPLPSLCSPVRISDIAFALIPGLGFDLETNTRLGYGKGHYDRLLVNATPSTSTWGIGFLEQSVTDLPRDTHDIHLNAIYLF